MIIRVFFALTLYSLLPAQLKAQDSLVMVNGKRIAFSRLAMYNGQVEIQKSEDKEYVTFPCDSVFGYCEAMKEETYFLKANPESDDEEDYLFLKRLEVGKVSLFESSKRDLKLYCEKDGRFEKVFGLTESGKQRAERLEIFKSFVSDDEESMAYIDSRSFNYKWKEIVKVIKYYNRRNYEEKVPTAEDVLGKVYLYRTQFQKTKEGLKIELFGERHDLYIQDYIQLDLPVAYASKLYFRDSQVKSTKVMSGELLEQYFEVLYDSKTNTFRLDEKKGTELQYEFFKIRDIVERKITR